MSILTNTFKKYTPDYNKLLDYGFKENKTFYSYEINFRNNEFKTAIKIEKNGKISAKVIDIENDEEYLPLNITSQQGMFVNLVRAEFEKILIDIRKNCFSENYFVSPQANRITKSIINKYGDYPNFMWEKHKGCGVFKNTSTNKWYGIIMDIDYSKLGENSKKFVEVINIKIDKEKIQELLKENGFYPAWHMNKKFWITITLDEKIPDKKILDLIDESHSFTIRAKKK